MFLFGRRAAILQSAENELKHNFPPTRTPASERCRTHFIPRCLRMWVLAVCGMCAAMTAALLLLRNYDRMPTANSFFRSCTHHRRPQLPPLSTAVASAGSYCRGPVFVFVGILVASTASGVTVLLQLISRGSAHCCGPRHHESHVKHTFL